MEKLQDKLNRFITLRESYLKRARNDEYVNNKIRGLQKQIREYELQNK